MHRHDGPVPYTEELYHPALLTPRTSRGEMEIAKNGDLVRRQVWPKVEESRVGQDFVTVVRDGEPNLLPIPTEMQPWIETLRAVLTGEDLPPQTAFQYRSEGKHWRMVQEIAGQEISLVFCGDALQQVELIQPDQTRRVLIFGPK